MNKKRLTIIYIIFNIFVITVIGVFDPHLRDFSEVICCIKLKWLIAGVLSALMSWLVDATILTYSVSARWGRTSFLQYLKVTAIGKYYSAVTPLASGGQPLQVYYMNKMGTPVGFSSSVLTVKFMIYRMVLFVCSLMALIFEAKTIFGYSKLSFWLSILGFVINGGGVLIVYFMSFNRTIIRNIIFKTLDFLSRFNVEKEKLQRKILTHVEEFHDSMRIFKNNSKGLLIIGLLSLIELVFYLSVTYFIYRAFGYNTASWYDILFVQLLLYLAVSYFPTPGSTGAFEGGFYVFFKLFFGKDHIFVAMLLWRLITYYMNIVIGGLVVFAESFKNLTGSAAERKKIPKG